MHCEFHGVLYDRTYKQKVQNKLEETKQTNKKKTKLDYNIKNKLVLDTFTLGAHELCKSLRHRVNSFIHDFN